MNLENYYYKLTDTPELGMIYWEEGKYLNPCACQIAAMPASVKEAQKKYILRIDSSYTIVADTDGGCDRHCEREDYQQLLPQNIIMEGDRPVGIYLDLGFYYSISPIRPNVIVIPFEDGAEYYHRDSRNKYTLIAYDPEKEYRSSSIIR